LLRAGQVDVALMLRTETDRDLDFAPLFEDDLNYVFSPQHPWSRCEQIRPEQISTETLILYNKASFTFRLLMDYFRAEGVSPSDYIELGSMEAIKELAKTGVGVGIIAPWVARNELEAGSLVCRPLGGRKLKREWGAAYLKGRRLALGEETFIGLCQEVALQLKRQAA
ncbi:MAG: LysR family transcriptional regulator, partial [Verrucomicrobia bacterium]